MAESQTRVIKRYGNRKLYDTSESHYVTLEHIAAMIQRGEEVVVVDNTNQQDITSVTLTQILFEEEKKHRGFLPLPTLRSIIQTNDTACQSQQHVPPTVCSPRIPHVLDLQDSSKPGVSEAPTTSKNPRILLSEILRTLLAYQQQLDEQLASALDATSFLQPLGQEFQRLVQKVRELRQGMGLE